MKIKDIPMLQYIKEILYCLVVLIMMISAVPYALIKGLGNKKYYQEWAELFSDLTHELLK